MILQAVTPLEAWLLVIIATIMPTILIYLLISRIQESKAVFKGEIGSLAFKFGGPVAFYAFLVWFGSSFIPPQALVTLEGRVTDRDGNPISGIHVGTLDARNVTDETGKFSITSLRTSSDKYRLAGYSNVHFTFKDVSPTPDKLDSIELNTFPPDEYTWLIGEALVDQNGNPVEAKVLVDVYTKPITPLKWNGEESVKIGIEKKYKVIYQDEEGNALWSEDVAVHNGQYQYPLRDRINLEER